MYAKFYPDMRARLVPDCLRFMAAYVELSQGLETRVAFVRQIPHSTGLECLQHETLGLSL